MNPYVVIDIGGTSIKYGLADAKGQLLETHEMPTEAQKGGPHILNTTKEIVARYLKKHPLAGVAISSAGMVDPDKGEIFMPAHKFPTMQAPNSKRKSKRPFRSLARLKMMLTVPVSQRSPQAMQKDRTMLFV